MTGRTLLTTALALVLIGGMVPSGSGAAPGGDPRTIRGKASTDGALALGAQEVLVVRGMPKRLPFQVAIGPAPSAPQCQGTFICEPSFGVRPQGGATFRTSGRGRAAITFVMPNTYFRRRFGNPAAREEIAFQPGELARIQANGFTINKKVQTTGIAVTTAPIALP